MINKELIAVIGYHDGSAGQVEAWVNKYSNYKIAFFVIDDEYFKYIDIENENNKRVCKTTEFPMNGKFKNTELIISKDWVDILLGYGIKKIISLESDNKKRYDQIKIILNSNLELISLIHPTSIIAEQAKIDKGVWINACCFIGYKTEVKCGVIINTGVRLDHHNILEECCQLDPSVVTAGNVVIRKFSHIHTGSIIINKIEIGENAVVGAGTVVINNVETNSVVVGNPGRIIRC